MKEPDSFEVYLGALQSLASPTPCGLVRRHVNPVAFFDLDRTLIAGYSVSALALERLRSGALGFRRLLGQLRAFVGYGLGRAAYHDLLEALVADLVGSSEQMLVDLGRLAFERRIRRRIYREGRELVAAHAAAGHDVVMVTSATRYQAAPVAAELGIDHLYCTELQIRSGRIAGVDRSCFGEGKLGAARDYLAVRSGQLDQCYFYSDSSDDLALLEAVGRPVTVNAKSNLHSVAQRRGWQQLRFSRLDLALEPRPV